MSKARLAIMNLSHLMSVPSSLVAVIELDVPNTIFNKGSNLPIFGGGEADNLERMLRLLTAYDIFEEHLMSNGVRKFSLAEVGKSLAEDEDGLSYAPCMLQHHQVSYYQLLLSLFDSYIYIHFKNVLRN
jgi:hypothetical protein